MSSHAEKERALNRLTAEDRRIDGEMAVLEEWIMSQRENFPDERTFRIFRFRTRLEHRALLLHGCFGGYPSEEWLAGPQGTFFIEMFRMDLEELERFALNPSPPPVVGPIAAASPTAISPVIIRFPAPSCSDEADVECRRKVI